MPVERHLECRCVQLGTGQREVAVTTFDKPTFGWPERARQVLVEPRDDRIHVVRYRTGFVAPGGQDATPPKDTSSLGKKFFGVEPVQRLADGNEIEAVVDEGRGFRRRNRIVKLWVR